MILRVQCAQPLEEARIRKHCYVCFCRILQLSSDSMKVPKLRFMTGDKHLYLILPIPLGRPFRLPPPWPLTITPVRRHPLAHLNSPCRRRQRCRMVISSRKAQLCQKVHGADCTRHRPPHQPRPAAASSWSSFCLLLPSSNKSPLFFFFFFLSRKSKRSISFKLLLFNFELFLTEIR